MNYLCTSNIEGSKKPKVGLLSLRHPVYPLSWYVLNFFSLWMCDPDYAH